MLPGTEACDMTLNGHVFFASSWGLLGMGESAMCAYRLLLLTCALSLRYRGLEMKQLQALLCQAPGLVQLPASCLLCLRTTCGQVMRLQACIQPRTAENSSTEMQVVNAFHVSGTQGNTLAVNAAQSDQSRRDGMPRCHLLLSTDVVCCSQHRIGPVSSGHTTIFLMLPNPQQLSSTSSCRVGHYYVRCGCDRFCVTAYAERASCKQAAKHAAASAAGHAGDCCASRARSTPSGENMAGQGRPALLTSSVDYCCVPKPKKRCAVPMV